MRLGYEAITNKPLEVSSIENQIGTVALLTDDQFITTTFSAVYTANQTGVAIITPTSGYKICVRVVASTTEAANGEVALDFGTSSKPIFRHYVAAAGSRASSVTGHLVGATDEPITLTTTTGANDLFLTVTYLEHK